LTFKKRFKGDCSLCKKQGHKGVDCWTKKRQENGNNSNRKNKSNNNGSGRDKSKIKCYGCGKLGHNANECKNDNEASNAVSSLFIRSVELNKEPEETGFKWEFTGLAKAMADEAPDQIIKIGEVEIEWKSGRAIHNDSPSNVEEFFDDENESEDESEDEDSIFPLSFTPHCNDSGDDASDFGDDEDSIPDLIPKSAIKVEDKLRYSLEEENECEPAEEAELQICMANLKNSNKMTGPLLDSRAAIHCGSSEKLMYQVQSPEKGTITVASRTTLNIEKVGTIYFEDTTTKSVMALKEYHCVPGLSKEMLSLGKWIDDGWKPELLPKKHILETEKHLSCANGMTQMECIICRANK
jgi:hypothetical protein